MNTLACTGPYVAHMSRSATLEVLAEQRTIPFFPIGPHLAETNVKILNFSATEVQAANQSPTRIRQKS